MTSPQRHTFATTSSRIVSLLLLAGTALALISLVVQSSAGAASGPTPGIGVKRWGNTYSTASGYDRYSYVNVGPGDAAKAGALATRSLVYMSGTSVQTSWSTGVSYQEALANNWLLKDASGSYLMNVQYGAYVGDIGNTAYQQRFIDNVTALLSGNGNDGVFIDDVLASPLLLTGGKYPAKYSSQAAWEDAQVSFVRNVGGALRARGFYVLVQAVAWIAGNPASDDGSLNAQFWGRLAPHVSGIQSEYWVQDPNSVTRLRASGPSWYQQWDAWLRLADAAQNGGADFFAMMYGATSDIPVMRYGKASFLLMWDGSGGAFTFDPGQSDPWNLEWTMDVGQPSGSKYQVGQGWRRNYSGGTVIVNPSPSSSQTFSLGGTFYRSDGTAVTSVTLAPTTALVLRGDAQSSPPPPPPPPPSEPLPLPTGASYLSDLSWISASNGWGPVEKDRSNGGSAAGDGAPITLNGTSYPKGLGVHAASDVRYALGGKCSRFKASVGVDDGIGSRGTIEFRVFADGTQVYSSGVMTGASATKSVDVSVTGANELRLVVTNGGDNIDYDHGDWAMAYVECGSEPLPPPAPPTLPSGSAYLSDLPWTSASNGWGPVEKDRSNGDRRDDDGLPLALNGTTYPKGLGVHAASEVRYALDAKCSRFRASVGVDDEVGTRGTIEFLVFADDTRVYASGILTGASATTTVDVPLTGAKELRLVVTNGGDNINHDHGDWAMARVECDSAPTPPPTSPTPPPPSPTPLPTVTGFYLSDASWTSASNGWGPVEKDRSNGDRAAGDGAPITLNGTSYPKGLGVHAASDVRYALGGKCSRFKASVGIDDEVGSNGTIEFRVFADGTQVYSSGVMTGASATKSVDVSVTGANELRLVVTNGGDNIDYDHGDWAMARVECGSARQASPSSPANTTPPTVEGAPQVGRRLTVSYGAWNGDPQVLAFVWSRCDLARSTCVPIHGATGPRYKPQPADVGQTLRVEVTARNAAGSASATSTVTAPVAPPPALPPAAAAPRSAGSPTINRVDGEGVMLAASPNHR